MNPDHETVLDALRRELRANAAFRKLSPEDQAWLVERLATGDGGTLAELAAALEARCGFKWGLTQVHTLRNRVQDRLAKMEGLREARRQIVDRLTAGAAIATDIERLARSALPGITTALAGLLGDRALSLVAQGGDPEETRHVLGDFLEAASGARADRDLQRKEGEADLDRKKFELMERKAQMADEAKAVTESALTAEQKAERYREIFGLA